MVGYRKAISPALWDELRAEGLIHPEAPAPVTPVLAD
jgi:D-threo-aldose 1-dehydrogenase